MPVMKESESTKWNPYVEFLIKNELSKHSKTEQIKGSKTSYDQKREKTNPTCKKKSKSQIQEKNHKTGQKVSETGSNETKQSRDWKCNDDPEVSENSGDGSLWW